MFSRFSPRGEDRRKAALARRVDASPLNDDMSKSSQAAKIFHGENNQCRRGGVSALGRWVLDVLGCGCAALGRRETWGLPCHR
jgi:hypothetical protein